MKKITSLPIVILAILACSSAASASEPFTLRPSIYRVPVSSATNILLTENPMGNPGISQEKLDSMVRNGQAESRSLDDILVTTSGGQVAEQTWLGKLEIEPVLTTDKKAIAMNISLTSDAISLSGQGAVFFGNSLFAGALKTKDGRSVIFLYLTPFQKLAEQGAAANP